MRHLLAACLALAIPAGANAQTMYKCVQNGKTVYQAEKCPDEAKQQTLQAPKAGPTQLTPAQKANSVDDALEVVAGFRACSNAMPEWGAMRRADYEAWRGRNAPVVARIEKEPAMQERYRDMMSSAPYGTPDRCNRVAGMMRAEPSK